MNHYQVAFDSTLRPSFDIVGHNVNPMDYRMLRRELVSCKRLAGLPVLEYFVEGAYADDFQPALRTYIVADRVRQCLQNCIDCSSLQFLEVRLIHRGSKMICAPFWLLNILDCVDALDEERSRWPDDDWKRDDPTSFVKVALRADAIADRHLCRISFGGKSSSQIFVSEHVKSHLEGLGITSGIYFAAVEAT